MSGSQEPVTAPVAVFLSYSHRDERHRERLLAHLSGLRRQGAIGVWHDRKIGAGSDWASEIDSRLNEARVILLLVTPDFLNSDYCYGKEMTRAIERHNSGEARVVPIIVRPCDWHGAPFSKLQAVPRDGKPVTRWPNRDEAWLDASRAIRAVILELTENSISQPEQQHPSLELRSEEPPSEGADPVAGETIGAQNSAVESSARDGSISFADLREAGEPLSKYAWRILEDLRTGTFNVQKPAIDALWSAGAQECSGLDPTLQEELGRTVLEASDIGSWRAQQFIKWLRTSGGMWPRLFIEGLLLGCLVARDGAFFAKTDHLVDLLSATSRHPNAAQIAERVVAAIGQSHPRWGLLNGELMVDDYEPAANSAREAAGREADAGLCERIAEAIENAKIAALRQETS